MKKYLTAYVSTLLVFLVCDGIWLGLLMEIGRAHV